MAEERFVARDFRLESGAALPELALAYETYGRLAPDRRNAVLVCHGFTSSHHAAGLRLDEPEAGWWDGVIGPGKALDTERFFVVSSNMLGSSYGSTNPASLDPRTGKPYGPDFPEFTLGDIVRAQKALIDSLGIPHLVAVAGPSYGGYQTFQWGVAFPDVMDGLVAVVSAPKGGGGVDALVARFARDPNWNGGRYYDRGGVEAALVAWRIETLKSYGLEAQLAERIADPGARAAAIRKIATLWARRFDANGLVALRRAASRFDVEASLARIRAKLLYVLSSTDELFPPSLAPDVMAKLEAAGVAARYFELESPYGHLASFRDAAKWAPALAAFMAEIAARTA